MNPPATGDPEIGLQLWTIRDLVERDLPAALAATREIGYRTVELAGFGSDGPAAMAEALRAAGLDARSAHISHSSLLDDFEGVIAALRAVGCTGLVIPTFAPELMASREQVERLAASLDPIARRAGDAGIAFALHNEESQLVPLEGTTPWSILVEATDPSLVSLQLDLFSMLAAGIDPLLPIERHGGRITSLHVCDRRDERYVPVGQGDIEWRPILDAIAGTACHVLYVEDEGAGDPVAAARASYDGLRRLVRSHTPAN
jgi:sugar phosphate isomerase/epimerase